MMIRTRKQVLRCDCCDMTGMAYVEGDRLVIVRKSHGEKHVLVLTLDTLRRKMVNIIS